MRADGEQEGVRTCGRCAYASLVAQRKGPSKIVANKNKWTPPNNNGATTKNITNPFIELQGTTRKLKTSYDSKKQKTQYEILVQPCCLTTRITDGVCDHMTLCSLFSYFSYKSYLKYLATNSKRDTSDCPSRRVPVRTTCTRHLDMVNL